MSSSSGGEVGGTLLVVIVIVEVVVVVVVVVVAVVIMHFQLNHFGSFVAVLSAISNCFFILHTFHPCHRASNIM